MFNKVMNVKFQAIEYRTNLPTPRRPVRNDKT